MHLSPTIETNFVRGYRDARLRICSNARSLRGMLCGCEHVRIDLGSEDSPVLVEETDDPGAFRILISGFINLARLRDLTGIIIPANGVHPPEACLFLFALHLGDTLPAIHPNHTLGLIVRGIFTELLKFGGREIVE